MKIALCLLTFNELPGCMHDVPLIKRSAFDQIFAIDGKSSDGTVKYLLSKKIPVYIQKIKGLNAAHVLAINKCKADAIIFFHPKGTVPVSDTLKFRKYFEKGYQFVVASRMIKGSINEEDKKIIKLRKWFIKILAVIIFIRWRKSGKIIWDVLHGFRGVTIKEFKKFNITKTGPTVDLEGFIGAYRNNLKRIEFPTKEKPRFYGETHFKFIPFGTKILKYLLKELFKP